MRVSVLVRVRMAKHSPCSPVLQARLPPARPEAPPPASQPRVAATRAVNTPTPNPGTPATPQKTPEKTNKTETFKKKPKPPPPQMGAGMKYIDVGGGLAVDYDGSFTDTHASMSYTLQNYANDVVSAMMVRGFRGRA
jgi:hypothetical protein